MENVRKRVKFDMVNTPKKDKLVNKPEFKQAIEINDNLFGISRAQTKILLDKPIIVGFAILDLSKLLMLDFTDTDSLLYEIETDDVYKDMEEYKDFYDFSEYPEDHPLYSPKNHKKEGKFKDEAKGYIIIEFVGLRAKMYSIIIQEQVKVKVIKKAKGVKKSTVKTDFHFDDYTTALTSEKGTNTATFNTIRSFNHQLMSIEQEKVGLNKFDDKRYLEDHINTLAHGHYKIQEYNESI